MKKAIILLLLLAGVALMAQERSLITVTKTELNNGVVIVTVTQQAAAGQAKASFELQCNKGSAACRGPEPGSYLMVRLPKNWGMYDCANVDLYPASADPETSQKIGEYCLIAK
jgi:hypothetical protein